MEIVIRENTWLPRNKKEIYGIDCGWGNGYVLIPNDHPLYKVEYDLIKVDVHGGLTFSSLVDKRMVEKWNLFKEYEFMWCVGFDTSHYGDTLHEWSKERVLEETNRLREQLINYTK